MGGGTWTNTAFTTYTSSVRGMSVDAFTCSNLNAQEIYTVRHLATELDPKNVVRECCDTEEHPNTLPVVLALDVTGSMGQAASQVAKKLNDIMTDLYSKVTDVEFMMMGIGDLAYDRAPIQATQFESDIRIAEQLDKVYFEGGGGGNAYESYTAAWYFGLYHTKLDCWNRGKKGIIITMGDEPLNPYLPAGNLANVTGDKLQADVDTAELYKAVTEKFDVYHLAVDDTETSYSRYQSRVQESFGKYLDGQHLIEVTLDTLAQTIVDIVANSVTENTTVTVNSNGEISW